MDYHAVIGGAATVIGVVGYVPYFRDIFRGTTKPHPFSWFLWALLAGIAFAAAVVAIATVRHHRPTEVAELAEATA